MPRGGNQARAAKRRGRNGGSGGPGSSHVGGKKKGGSKKKLKEACRFGCGTMLVPGRKVKHENNCSRNPANEVKRHDDPPLAPPRRW